MLDSFFSIVLCLSIIVILYIVSRLYNAIKVLNARVTLLSTQVKSLRESTRHALQLEHSDTYSHFERQDQELQATMKRDFTYKKSPLDEMIARWRVDPAQQRPGGQEPAAPKPKKSASEIRGISIKPALGKALRSAKGHPGGAAETANSEATGSDSANPAPPLERKK